MKPFVFAFAVLALLHNPVSADAQTWRETLAAAEKAREAPQAAALFRQALEQGAEGRERVRAFHGLAGALMQTGDWAGVDKAVEEARLLITANWGADDLAMAGNRQLYGVLRLRRNNDREGARQAFAEAARIRNAKVAAWDDSEGPLGAVGHKPSGVKLPPRAGVLTQFRRDINNDDGTDVSVGYRASGQAGGVSITLYIYRPEGEFPAVFEQEKQGVRSFNRNAILQKERAYPVETPGGKVEGRVALFEYAGQGGVVGTRLYLFPLKGDYLKLRVTHRIEDADFVDAQVASLLGALGWPAR